MAIVITGGLTFSGTMTVVSPLPPVYTLWAWGAGGTMPTNDTTARSSPTQVGARTGWSLVSMGVYSSAAISS